MATSVTPSPENGAPYDSPLLHYESGYWGADLTSAVFNTEKSPKWKFNQRMAHARVYDKNVRRVITGEINPDRTINEGVLDLDDFAVGTLLLIDSEELRPPIAAVANLDCIAAEPNYPTYNSHYLNCSPEDLIRIQAAKHAREDYGPGRFIVVSSAKEYVREAWFGMVIDTPDGRGIISYKNIRHEPGHRPPNQRQDEYNWMGRLHNPALIGNSTIATYPESRPGDQIQARIMRIRQVSIYNRAVHDLAKEQAKIKYGSRRLGGFVLRRS